MGCTFDKKRKEKELWKQSNVYRYALSIESNLKWANGSALVGSGTNGKDRELEQKQRKRRGKKKRKRSNRMVPSGLALSRALQCHHGDARHDVLARIRSRLDLKTGQMADI